MSDQLLDPGRSLPPAAWSSSALRGHPARAVVSRLALRCSDCNMVTCNLVAGCGDGNLRPPAAGSCRNGASVRRPQPAAQRRWLHSAGAAWAGLLLKTKAEDELLSRSNPCPHTPQWHISRTLFATFIVLVILPLGTPTQN